MRSIRALAIGVIALLGMATTAMAQRDAADRADRGQRLDSNAFRNDMLQDQLKKPNYPQTWRGTPEPTPAEKSKPAARKPKPN